MESGELRKLIDTLIFEGKFRRAKTLLMKARNQSSAEGDTQTLQYVLTQLIALCFLVDPPALAEAEALSRERELLIPSAFSTLETAMMLQTAIGDYARAIPKLEEAIAKGKAEKDDMTLYTGLGALGQAHLELGHEQEALAVLNELEDMVASKGRFVVGDE